MRKISATYIFPISNIPIKYGTVVLDNQTEIIQVIDSNGSLAETAALEYYNGVIVPGLINISYKPIEELNINHGSKRLNYLRGIRTTIKVEPANRNFPDIGKIKLNHFSSIEKSEPEQEYDYDELPGGRGIYIVFETQGVIQTEKRKIFLVPVNSISLIDHTIHNTLQHWYVIGLKSLQQNSRTQLLNFFCENSNRIIFNWESVQQEELYSLLEYFLDPQSGLTLHEVLKAATLNPSAMIAQENITGEFKPGLTPGICLIDGINFKNLFPLKGKIRIKRLA